MAILNFGVVIPTKNSMKYLPGHLENLSTWIDLAGQVVVVDSYSKDGTVDFLKKELRHPNIRFVDHPPGLYASWNHGISQLSTEYCYISTVGDSLTRAGAGHLVSAATKLQCDVLVTRPNFIAEDGQPCEGPEWPMDGVIENLELTEPCLLSPAAIVISAFFCSGGALTGSCASDLFRTEILQRFPFPLDFGTAGDGAWSLDNASRLRWGVSPERVTTFRCHPPTASAQEVTAGGAIHDYLKAKLATLNRWLEEQDANSSWQIIADLQKRQILAATYAQCRLQHSVYRKSRWPWIFQPKAWRVRSQRNQLKSQTAEIAQRIFQSAQLRQVDRRAEACVTGSQAAV